MPQAFLTSNLQTAQLQSPDPTMTPERDRETVRLLVIGTPHACDRIIHELHRLRFSEVHEWSKPLPTEKPGEVMRILTRHILPAD